MIVVVAALALLALFGALELVAWVRELLEDRRMYRAAIAGWQSAAERAERLERSRSEMLELVRTQRTELEQAKRPRCDNGSHEVLERHLAKVRAELDSPTPAQRGVARLHAEYRRERASVFDQAYEAARAASRSGYERCMHGVELGLGCVECRAILASGDYQEAEEPDDTANNVPDPPVPGFPLPVHISPTKASPSDGASGAPGACFRQVTRLVEAMIAAGGTPAGIIAGSRAFAELTGGLHDGDPRATYHLNTPAGPLALRSDPLLHPAHVHVAGPDLWEASERRDRVHVTADVEAGFVTIDRTPTKEKP